MGVADYTNTHTHTKKKAQTYIDHSKTRAVYRGILPTIKEKFNPKTQKFGAGPQPDAQRRLKPKRTKHPIARDSGKTRISDKR